MILIIRSHYSVLYNEIFWLVASWSLIIGIYLCSGIQWSFPVSISTWFFLALCFLFFFAFRLLGLKTSIKIKKSTSTTRLMVKARTYAMLGIVGSIVYIVDYIRLNGIQFTKIDYSISFIGVLGNLFLPILLVIGLYFFANSYINEGKISKKGLLCLAIYITPCIINGGRESVLYLGISLTAIIGFSKWKNRQTQGSQIKNKKSFFNVLILATGLGSLVYIIVLVSNNRFTQEVTNFYLNVLNVPDTMRAEAALCGNAQNLYANFVYYFVHELPGLELVLRFYDGPYMCGVYELNIISRRLPDFMGLDYTLVLDSMKAVMAKTGDSAVLEYGWKTILASLIFDFGKWLTPIICGILGFCTGNIRKKFSKDKSIQNLVLVSIVCLSMFTTIQLGPFFNLSVYGSYIWWYIIFKTHIHAGI